MAPGRRTPIRSSSTRRFCVTVAIFVGIQAIALGLALASIEGINMTRAYAVGEGMYSKAQKAAALSLHRFARSGDAAHYDVYLQALAAPIGDRLAREALERPTLDLAAVSHGFLQGKNHPSDVHGMAVLFRLLSGWGPFALAVEDWRQADRLVARLEVAGQELHDVIVGAGLASPRVGVMLARIDAIDGHLNALEDSFAQHMGEAARTARDLVFGGLTLSSAALWSIAIWISWRLQQRGVRAETALVASEQRFRDFAVAASDWFWESDRDGRFSYMSRRFAERADADGRAFVDRFADVTVGAGLVGADGAVVRLDRDRPESFRDLRYEAAGPDGSSRTWSISGTPRFDPDGRFLGYRGTSREITHESAIRRELVEAKEQAELANRAKSDFLANMSHELRTPLNAVLGFSEIMQSEMFGPVGDARYACYVRDIHGSATHLLAVINDILDLSKIEAGKVELAEQDVELGRVIAAVETILRERIQEGGLTLQVECAAHVPPLRADERKCKQILVNLLSNAVKFTAPGGTIRIVARTDIAGDLVLEVVDTGIGIAKRDLARAMSPFGQVDSSLSRQFQGTGLGLPLARSLAELHGGRFELESEPGRGTTARVVFPAARLRARPVPRYLPEPAIAAAD